MPSWNTIKDKNRKNDYLSILATVKNEAQYLKEWIEYHRMIGVDRFYIYDNDSTDNIKDVLAKYIDEGIVVYNNNFKGYGKQVSIYEDGLTRYCWNTFWMAIIDIDEFLVPVEKNNLPDFLKDYEDYPGVAVNWVLFDGNEHIKKPDGLVIENYKRAFNLNAPPNQVTKSIVRPTCVLEPFGVHNFNYFTGNAVNENFAPVVKGDSKNSVAKIRINHYYSKSLEEYQIKAKKRDNNGSGKADMSVYNEFGLYNDNIMDKYIDQLKE